MSPTLAVVIAIVGLLADVVIVLGFLASLNRVSRFHAKEEGINQERMAQMGKAIDEVKRYCDDLDQAQRQSEKDYAELKGKMDAIVQGQADLARGQGKIEALVIRHLERGRGTLKVRKST